MTIGIDGNEANVDKLVGVSVYTINLLHYFKKQATPTIRFRVFLKRKPKPHLPEENEYFIYETVKPPLFWSQAILPFRLMKKDVDVFFSPAHYAPRFCPAPSVVTIHDLSYFYYPDEFLKKDLYKLINWTKYSIRNAKKIISVSETTKKDLLKFYNLSPDKITVINNGFEKNAIRGKKPSKFHLLPKTYILYVGTLQPRKNIPTLIRAFAKFKKENPGFKLVIAGKKGWLYQRIFMTAKQQGIGNDIVFTDYLPDEELVYLYENSFCLVNPSLYEGFGIPLLEAMSFDCPVIASNVSSLPEIGGDACLYFNPTDENELYKRLTLLVKSKKIKEDLIQKGKKRVKLFSWEKCARETLEVLKNAAHAD